MPSGERVYGVPATRLAEELGRKVVLNIVMVGFFGAVTNLLEPDALRKAVADSVPPAAEAQPASLRQRLRIRLEAADQKGRMLRRRRSSLAGIGLSSGIHSPKRTRGQSRYTTPIIQSRESDPMSVVEAARPQQPVTLAQLADRCLYYMSLMREIEDRIERKLYRQGKILGGVYVGRGQEAIPVGTALLAEPEDVLLPSHRDMAVFFIRGIPPGPHLRAVHGTRGRPDARPRRQHAHGRHAAAASSPSSARWPPPCRWPRASRWR